MQYEVATVNYKISPSGKIIKELVITRLLYIEMKVIPCEFVYDNTNNNSDFTCEFWINNCQFEIFYDLDKHFDTTGSNADPIQYSIASVDNVSNSGLELNDLPTEMLSRIFSMCTAVELLALRNVCLRWKQVIKHDKALWNHVVFSAVDLDVKTTISLLKDMPLLRTVYLCDVYSPEDMRLLVLALCNACWELRHVHFPEYCQYHPSPQDLHELIFYHPRIESLQLCTKQKLTAVDIENIGQVLAEYSYLSRLKLEGFYWYQPQLTSELFAHIQHLSHLQLPSLPGINGNQIKQLSALQPNLENLSINTSSLTGSQINFNQFKFLKKLEVIDSSPITNLKLAQFNKIVCLNSLNVNLSKSNKENVLQFFKTPLPFLESVTVSNCEFSNDLLALLPESCARLLSLVWLNPKDVSGEVSDAGILAITKLKFLINLVVKSRSVSKTHYPELAKMRSLKYARINGMRVAGCC